MGQPNLDKKFYLKQKNLKAIINVESNFMDNMDYDYCFKKGIHVIATSPVFSKPVAEIALGMTYLYYEISILLIQILLIKKKNMV